jgi:hypothetical protein
MEVVQKGAEVVIVHYALDKVEDDACLAAFVFE